MTQDGMIRGGMITSHVASMNNDGPTMYVTDAPAEGLRCIADVKRVCATDEGRAKWLAVQKYADICVAEPALTPHTELPQRPAGLAEKGWRDYVICAEISRRITCASLAWLMTQNDAYRDAAMEQVALLFDEAVWPAWVDQHHVAWPCDLRTGQLGLAVGLTCNWLRGGLTVAQKQWMVDGLKRRAFDPFWDSVDRGAGFATLDNNWLTVIVGGLGIAAMAMIDDLPDAQRMIDFATPPMQRYVRESIGDEGEFNESPGYAGSLHRPTLYFQALRYADIDGDCQAMFDRLALACRWVMYTVAPPGRVASLGDSHVGARPMMTHFAAIADVKRDEILQWFYLTYGNIDEARSDPAMELLSFDPTLASQSPEGELPRGRAFVAYGEVISSRSDWHPHTTASVVISKAGQGREHHGHHDNGVVTLDGYGKELLVDMGVPRYPGDYFGPNRYAYYFASVRGHNVPQVNGLETRATDDFAAKVIASAFDDEAGGWWQIDLTPLYVGATKMVRTIVHLLPTTLVVFDDVTLDQPGEVAIRWHPHGQPAPCNDGRFAVEHDGVHLACQMVGVGGAMVMRRGEHVHVPPNTLDRTGQPLADWRPRYIDGVMQGTRCRALSLFEVSGEGVTPSRWTFTDERWQIGQSTVIIDGAALVVRQGDRSWRVTI